MNLTPLPVDSVLPDVLRAVREQRAVVLHAPTGAGKTTRVPPALADALDGVVVVLEPRRLAARAAARRMAFELGCAVGGRVGYHVRFDRKTGPDTRIVVVTTGMFLRTLTDDPFLEGVSAVVFDEFHERSLDADLALGWVRRLRADVRPDLVAVAMSATFDTGHAAEYLGGAPVVSSSGRAYPVSVEYLAAESQRPQAELVRSALIELLDRPGCEDGDVLVFLPGMGEIRRCERALAGAAAARAFDVHVLHGDLDGAVQDAALARGPRRKVVLATNVAETSVTVEGVVAVIDGGQVRRLSLDAAVGVPRLVVGRIAKSSADQRSGRAGRTRPGVAKRLWTASRHRLLPDREEPEVRRADLAPAVLQLLDWGESDPLAFPWLDAPPDTAVDRAVTLLRSLGAIAPGESAAEEGSPARHAGLRLTALGSELARLPVHPRLGRLLLEGRARGVPRRAALVAALLSERSPFSAFEGAARHVSESDVIDRVDALEQFEDRRFVRSDVGGLRPHSARQLLRARDQLARLIGAGGRDRVRGDAADDALLRAIHVTFADRLARRREPGGSRALMRGGRGVRLADSSAVREAELFVCVDVEAGPRGERAEARVRLASAVRREWIEPASLTTVTRRTFDSARGRVMAVRETRLDDLVLAAGPTPAPADAETAAVLAEAAREDPAAALGLDDPDVVQFRARVAFLRHAMPELELPAVDDDALLARLPRLCDGSTSFDDLRAAGPVNLVRALLTHEHLRALERHAPERLPVPSGSHIRLTYQGDRAPVLAARIQELFGLAATPRVAGGRVPVLLHLLAPNHRPQQVTDDLESFWNTTYPVVRKELRRRYPRHAWPEDPWTARAEHRPTRRNSTS